MLLSRRDAVVVFLALAFAYFFSALVRAISLSATRRRRLSSRAMLRTIVPSTDLAVEPDSRRSSRDRPHNNNRGQPRSQRASSASTPLMLQVSTTERDLYAGERFGPVSFVIACDSAQDALAQASASGIAGRESFFEHVHFNFTGNYRLGLLWAEHAARALGREHAKVLVDIFGRATAVQLETGQIEAA